MSYYIVCQKKRNNPRMDVRVCQKKCNWKEDCKPYISYHKILVQDKDAPLSAESHAVGLGVT
jgi:hypothetical protein